MPCGLGGTHCLRPPGTASACRGCGASAAPPTDRWPGFCENRVDSGVGPEAHWGPEAGGKSGGAKRERGGCKRRDISGFKKLVGGARGMNK